MIYCTNCSVNGASTSAQSAQSWTKQVAEDERVSWAFGKPCKAKVVNSLTSSAACWPNFPSGYVMEQMKLVHYRRIATYLSQVDLAFGLSWGAWISFWTKRIKSWI